MVAAKKRIQIKPQYLGYIFKPWEPEVETHSVLLGRISTLDESHGNPSPYRTGSDFLTRSAETSISGESFTWARSSGEYYQGTAGDSLFARPPVESELITPPPRNDYLYYGTDAYNRLKPDKPLINLGESIFELRDIRNLTSLYRQGAKRFSDMYLDYQFGRGAVARDIIELLHITDKLKNRIKQLERDNGKSVRREGTILTNNDSSSSTETIHTNGTQMVPPLVGNYYPAVTFERVITRSDTTKWWFSGKFRTYIPPTDFTSNKGIAPIARRLLGLDLNAELAWNIIPWSWFADWFGNVGSILSNIDSFTSNGLASEYAYIMCSRDVTITSSSPVMGIDGITRTLESRLVRSLKSRAGASPYGFGIDPGQFTPGQLSILAALGISKMPDRSPIF